MAENRAEVKLERAKLLAAQRKAFRETNNLIERELQQRITAKIWPWPNETIKYSKAKRRRLQSGRLSKRRILGREGTTRDIVDDGQLRDSYKRIPNGLKAVDHTYTARYALAVHNGAVFRSGHTMPARPWIRVTLREVDLGKYFQTLLAAEVKRIRTNDLG